MLGTLDEAVGYIKASNPEGGYLSAGQGEALTIIGIGGDRFGASLSIREDGNTLAIGTPSEDSNATGVNGNQHDNSDAVSGAVYVFCSRLGRLATTGHIRITSCQGRGRMVKLSLPAT